MPEAIPTGKRILAGIHRAVSALPAGSVLLAADESHLNLLPWVRSTWVLTGSRLPVMTPGSNVRRTILGALDLASGRWLYRISTRANSSTFIAFLDHILAVYPTAPVIAIVLDNVITHRSLAVRQWLNAHPQVRFLYGARYSPHDNPVERVWAALKRHLANSPLPSMHQRLRQVSKYFDRRSRQQMLSTASLASCPWLRRRNGKDFWHPA